MSSERRCLVAGSDAAVTASLAGVLAAAPGLACAGVVEPVAAVSGLTPACDAVLLCDGGGRTAIELAPRVIGAFPHTPVLLVTATTDVGAYQAALSAGARGVLGMPPDAGQLTAAIFAAIRTTEGRRVQPAGRAVAVCGSKGGCGCSVLAAGLAQLSGGMLVDLATGFDDAAERLGCVPARTLDDMTAIEGDPSPDALRGIASRHPAGWRLVARGAGAQGAPLLAPELIRALVRESRAVAGLTTFDLGVAVSESAAALALSADRTLLVTTPDPAAVSCAARAAGWLEQRGMPAGSLGLVVNRWRRGGELSLRGIERRAGLPIAAAIRDGEPSFHEGARRSSALADLLAELERS